MAGIEDFFGGAAKRIGAVPRMVQNIAANPVVRGIGLTAAAGFNPLLGLMAAPSIQNSMESESQDRELAALELKAARERLDRSQKLRGGLDDLVSSMAAVGVTVPDAHAMVPGAARGAGQASEPRIRSDQEQFLRTLIQGGETGAASELIGGLLEMGPKQPARGLQGTLETVRHWTGRDLSEDEIFRIADGGDSALVQQLGLTQAHADLLRKQLELRVREDEVAEEADEREAAELRKQQDFLDQVNRDLEAADILDELDDSILAKPGFGSGARGQIQSALGLVDEGSGRLSSLRQRFDQLSTLAGLDVVKAYGLNPTDQKFKRMMETSLAAENDPSVNRMVLLDRFRAATEKGGENLPEGIRAAIEARIKQHSSGTRRNIFSSEKEIGQALKAGDLKRGDTVILNGKRFRIE